MNEPTNDRPADETAPLYAEMKALRRRLDEAEATLRTERQMFQAMADSLTEVVFTASPPGLWDFVNSRFCENTGIPIDAALGHGWTKALHPDDLQRVIQDMRAGFLSRAPFESHFRLQSPLETYRRFVAMAHPLLDDSGRIVRWIGTATDIDDLLRAEDALEQAGQKNKAYLAKLVHDLRNALAPIANAAAVLRSPRADAVQTQRAIEIIDGQVRDFRAFFDKIQSPAADAAKRPAEPKEPIDTRLLKQPARRILVVASDGNFAEEWSVLLGVAGHSVCAAGDISQALEMVHAFQPEILAVKLPLPETERGDWAQRLRKQPGLEKVFLVAIHAKTNGPPHSILAGFDAVLWSPVKLQDFLKAIAAHEQAESQSP